MGVIFLIIFFFLIVLAPEVLVLFGAIIYGIVELIINGIVKIFKK